MNQGSQKSFINFLVIFTSYILLSLLLDSHWINIENAFIFDKIKWSVGGQENFLDPLLFTQPFLPFMLYFLPGLLFGFSGLMVFNGLTVAFAGTFLLNNINLKSFDEKLIGLLAFANPILIYIAVYGGIAWLSLLVFMMLIFFLCRFLLSGKLSDLMKASLFAAALIICIPYSGLLLISLIPFLILATLIIHVEGEGILERLELIIDSKGVRKQAFRELLLKLLAFYSLPVLMVLLGSVLEGYAQSNLLYQLNYYELVDSVKMSIWLKLALLAGMNVFVFSSGSALPKLFEFKLSYWFFIGLQSGFVLLWPYNSLYMFLLPSCFAVIFFGLIRKNILFTKAHLRMFFIDLVLKFTILFLTLFGSPFLEDNFRQEASQNVQIVEQNLISYIDKNIDQDDLLIINPDFLYPLSPAIEGMVSLIRTREIDTKCNFILFHKQDPRFLALVKVNNQGLGLPTKIIRLSETSVLKLLLLSEDYMLYQIVRNK